MTHLATVYASIIKYKKMLNISNTNFYDFCLVVCNLITCSRTFLIYGWHQDVNIQFHAHLTPWMIYCPQFSKFVICNRGSSWQIQMFFSRSFHHIFDMHADMGIRCYNFPPALLVNGGVYLPVSLRGVALN